MDPAFRVHVENVKVVVEVDLSEGAQEDIHLKVQDGVLKVEGQRFASSKKNGKQEIGDDGKGGKNGKADCKLVVTYAL